jgi:hypothetical protein
MAGLRVKVGDKFGVNNVDVSAFTPKERPTGGVYVDITDENNDYIAGVSLSAEGVRDLITALEYALLYQAGEV